MVFFSSGGEGLGAEVFEDFLGRAVGCGVCQGVLLSAFCVSRTITVLGGCWVR